MHDKVVFLAFVFVRILFFLSLFWKFLPLVLGWVNGLVDAML